MSWTIPLVQAAIIRSANDNTERWAWGTRIGDDGLFNMSGTGAIPGGVAQPVEGTTLTVEHALLAPNIGDSLGTMYGVASGSGSLLRRENDQVVVDLRNVATLQDCGDFPVEGELNLCYDGGEDCPSNFDRGILDNYSWEDDVTSYSPTGSDLRASIGSQGATLRARLDSSGTTFAWAFFGTSLYSRYEGKTLCAGAGSELTTMTAAGTTYTVIRLRNLAWLEGPGTGQISGCLR